MVVVTTAVCDINDLQRYEVVSITAVVFGVSLAVPLPLKHVLVVCGYLIVEYTVWIVGGHYKLEQYVPTSQ